LICCTDDRTLELTGTEDAERETREEATMSTTCECGVTLEQPGRTARCQECDVAACPSCVITVETITYCRWCATVLARHRVA
jgi:hypothetical protein